MSKPRQSQVAAYRAVQAAREALALGKRRKVGEDKLRRLTAELRRAEEHLKVALA